MKDNHVYGYRACWLPSMLHPADWNYSLFHMYFKCDTLVYFNNDVSVFWIQAPCIIIFAFLWKDNFLAICNFFIFQKNWIFMKNFIKNWLKIVKNQCSIFHIFQKKLKNGFEITTGKTHHKIKLQRLRKIPIWTFGSLVHHINSF